VAAAADGFPEAEPGASGGRAPAAAAAAAAAAGPADAASAPGERRSCMAISPLIPSEESAAPRLFGRRDRFTPLRMRASSSFFLKSCVEGA